jgi:transcriptional regulator GlxA family with amidase domain
LVARKRTNHHHFDDERVAGAIKLIVATTRRPVVLSEMAMRLGCSPHTLQRGSTLTIERSIGAIAQL